MTSPELRIKKLDPKARLPHRAHEGDAGLDLSSAVKAVLEPGQVAHIPTGIAIAFPEGWAGLVLPRSGLAANYGITVLNSPGLIDSGYRGEVRVMLINHGAFPRHIQEGDRVAQLVPVRLDSFNMRVTPDLDETARGGGGFGSTGR